MGVGYSFDFCSSFFFYWRYESGCPKLIGSFTFSRKRNVVELEIKQDTTVKGSKKFLVRKKSWKYNKFIQIII